VKPLADTVHISRGEAQIPFVADVQLLQTFFGEKKEKAAGVSQGMEVVGNTEKVCRKVE